MGHGRALAIARRRRHQRQRQLQTRIQLFVQRLTADDALRLRRRVELGADDGGHVVAVGHWVSSLLLANNAL